MGLCKNFLNVLVFDFSSWMQNKNLKKWIIGIIFAIYFSGSSSSKLSVIYRICLCEAQNWLKIRGLYILLVCYLCFISFKTNHTMLFSHFASGVIFIDSNDWTCVGHKVYNSDLICILVTSNIKS